MFWFLIFSYERIYHELLIICLLSWTKHNSQIKSNDHPLGSYNIIITGI